MSDFWKLRDGRNAQFVVEPRSNFRNKIEAAGLGWYIRLIIASTRSSSVACLRLTGIGVPHDSMRAALSGLSAIYLVFARCWPRSATPSPDGGEYTKSKASAAEMGKGVRIEGGEGGDRDASTCSAIVRKSRRPACRQLRCFPAYARRFRSEGADYFAVSVYGGGFPTREAQRGAGGLYSRNPRTPRRRAELWDALRRRLFSRRGGSQRPPISGWALVGMGCPLRQRRRI